MGFDHALHSDVIMTLMYSINLCLTFGRLMRFENKQFDVVTDGTTLKKVIEKTMNNKVLKNVVYHHLQSLRF